MTEHAAVAYTELHRILAGIQATQWQRRRPDDEKVTTAAFGFLYLLGEQLGIEPGFTMSGAADIDTRQVAP